MAVDVAALAERDTSAHTMVTRPGTYDVRVARHFGDPGIVAVVEVADPAG